MEGFRNNTPPIYRDPPDLTDIPPATNAIIRRAIQRLSQELYQINRDLLQVLPLQPVVQTGASYVQYGLVNIGNQANSVTQSSVTTDSQQTWIEQLLSFGRSLWRRFSPI